MARQYDSVLRNDLAQAYVDSWGSAPKFRILTGAQPADNAASETGTRLIDWTLPSAPLDVSGPDVSISAAWTGTVSADGTAGYYRVLDNAATRVVEQGGITRAFPLTTSASTSAGNNVLTFTDTTGASDGMTISGTGVPSGATVLSHTSTTVTMSAVSTAGVSSSAVIYFGDTSGQLWLLNTALTSGQPFTIATWPRSAPGA